MTTLRSLFGFIALICILSLPVNSFAKGHNKYDDVEIEIITDRRGSLPLLSAHSKRATLERHYIIAKHNEPYRLRVTNQSNRRVGVVIAIDGRNILSGQSSELKSYEALCVLEPYQTKYYGGWHVGRHQINGFLFNTMDTYSGRGYSQNGMGVIALAVFNEKHQGKNGYYNVHKGKNKKSAGSNGRTVHFKPGKRAHAEKIINYASHENLCQKGIVQCGPRHRKNHLQKTKRQNNRYVSSPSWHFELRL